MMHPLIVCILMAISWATAGNPISITLNPLTVTRTDGKTTHAYLPCENQEERPFFEGLALLYHRLKPNTQGILVGQGSYVSAYFPSWGLEFIPIRIDHQTGAAVERRYMPVVHLSPAVWAQDDQAYRGGLPEGLSLNMNRAEMLDTLVLQGASVDAWRATDGWLKLHDQTVVFKFTDDSDKPVGIMFTCDHETPTAP